MSWLGSSLYQLGPITTITSGNTTTLGQAKVQRVVLETDGAAATALFPASPNDGDAIWVHTFGTTVSNQATVNPNGNHIENPQAPGGTTGTSNITMGPNPGASALFVYELSGTLWRLWQ